MTQQQKEKALQIARMCMEVTALGKHEAFFNYAGHVNMVSIYIDSPINGMTAYGFDTDCKGLNAMIARLQELGATPPLTTETAEKAILAEMQAVAKGSVRAFCLKAGYREATFHKILQSGFSATMCGVIKLLFSLGFKIVRA